MAGQGARRSGGSARRGRSNAPARTAKAASRQANALSRRASGPSREASTPSGGVFRLGAVEGTTPGKWIDAWRERMPGIPLELVPLRVSDQRTALAEASVDAALVRLPLDRAGLHLIALYEEISVVVCPADSHLTAADELTLADLAGETLIVPRDPPLEVDVPGALAPRFAAPASAGEAIEIVATGVGVVVVPMSLARLHHRKDVSSRPLTDGPRWPVALSWRDDGPTPPLVDAFIGIVRGRTPNSSR